MSKRGTQTSSLKNVIQVLTLGNKSGILTVTADTSAMSAEGRIVFIRGVITDVHLGKVSGQRALHALLQWGTCSFIFSEVESTTEPAQFSLTPPVDSGPLPNTEHQIERFSHVDSQYKSARQMPQPTRHLDAASLIIPIRLRRDRDTESLQRLSYARFSRAHMHLFLLINGERALQDLARLLQRSDSEVEKLLFDLKKSGFIHY